MSTHILPGPQVTLTFRPTGGRPLVRWRPTCTHGHNPQSPTPPCRQKPTGWHGMVIDLGEECPRPVLEPTCSEHRENDFGDDIAAEYGIRRTPPRWAPAQKEER